jgi:fructokinase
MKSKFYGAIEGGGTKFLCAVIDQDNTILAQERIATTMPEKTLRACLSFFRQSEYADSLSALGIACFGPLDPNPASVNYGKILATPKPGWANTDVVGFFNSELGIPIGFDTDVNAAVLAEAKWGAGSGLSDVVYYTIGTGIGAGAMVNGQLLHGMIHTEMGHVRLPHDFARDPYPGGCPFHGDCFEGLASGPAIESRWGVPATELPPDHPAWELEAEYIALALQGLICTLAPQRIILGGGVMTQKQLFPLIRKKTASFLNGYIQTKDILEGIEEYIVSPGLGAQSGILGAKALAEDKLIGFLVGRVPRPPGQFS